MLQRGALDHVPEGAQVVILYVPVASEELVEVEAVLHAVVDGVAIFIRPNRKRATFETIQWNTIERIQVRRESSRIIQAKMLKVTTLDDVRLHLVNNHNVLLSWINRVNNETAQAMHDNIDHRDLGHIHPDTLMSGKTNSPSLVEMIGDEPAPTIDKLRVSLALPLDTSAFKPQRNPRRLLVDAKGNQVEGEKYEDTAPVITRKIRMQDLDW